MANNTLKLHRTHYSISETAKILGCDEQDVIYIADEKDIPLSLRKVRISRSFLPKLTR